MMVTETGEKKKDGGKWQLPCDAVLPLKKTFFPSPFLYYFCNSFAPPCLRTSKDVRWTEDPTGLLSLHA